MKRLSLALLLLAAVVACTPAVAQPAPSTKAAAPKTWFIRLIPPRPTFDKDIKPAEQQLMEQHHAYWKDLYDKGICLFGGPVLDPDGAYGVLAVKADTLEKAEALAMGDPSVKAKLNRFEVAPMRIVFPPKAAAE